MSRDGTPAKRQRRDEYRASLGAPPLTPGATSGTLQLPKKKFYRQRAHANPFSDHALIYPRSPAHMDWAALYPAFAAAADEPDTRDEGEAAPADKPRPVTRDVEVADIGCGFGGLLFALAPRLPDTLMLGMEIRTSVAEFVQEKVRAMRARQGGANDAAVPSAPTGAANEVGDGSDTSAGDTPGSGAPVPSTTDAPVPGGYENIACVRANAMKFLPNFFRRGQLSRVFICFPDPHFKARKHKARIVSAALVAEYAYVLRPGGWVYTITDVQDLHDWMVRKFEEGGGGFERVGEEEVAADECAGVMLRETEEGKKVERNRGVKLVACFRRLADPPWP